MDFRFNPEQELFRAELRAFLDEAWPVEIRRPLALTVPEHEWEASRAFTKALVARNWVAPAWPKEYGGLGLGYLDYSIYLEEMALASAPSVDRFSAVQYLGPIIIRHGTDEQKARFLPGILRGEDVWCQGFSEPGSGSDLASLKLRAERQGDDYVLNGQKIWTGHATTANWCFVLARTDPNAPRHRGISFFLMNLRSPGLTVRGMEWMTGETATSEVFYDNVRIPATNRVGEENRGWYVATDLLNFERLATGTAATTQRLVSAYTQLLRETKPVEPGIKTRLADLAIASNVARCLALLVASRLDAGQPPDREASAVKLFATELTQRLAAFAVDALGLYGQSYGPSHRSQQTDVVRSYLQSRGLTVAGGTSEIQRGVIATRGVGLPRG